MKYAREGEVLLLKTVNADGTAYGGFQWPRTGTVVAHGWNPNPKYGGGLHGLLRGCGDRFLLSLNDDAIWIVFAAREDEVVEFNGKAKVPRARVIYYGERQRAIDLLCEEYPDAPIVYGTATAGYGGTATAGDCGTATAGDFGTATAGYGGTATAGYGGTATAGREGTATAGDFGTATAGREGTAIVGKNGCIQLKYWDGERTRIVTGYIGENGLEPGVPYRLDENHQFAGTPARGGQPRAG